MSERRREFRDEEHLQELASGPQVRFTVGTSLVSFVLEFFVLYIFYAVQYCQYSSLFFFLRINNVPRLISSVQALSLHSQIKFSDTCDKNVLLMT